VLDRAEAAFVDHFRTRRRTECLARSDEDSDDRRVEATRALVRGQRGGRRTADRLSPGQEIVGAGGGRTQLKRTEGGRAAALSMGWMTIAGRSNMV